MVVEITNIEYKGSKDVKVQYLRIMRDILRVLKLLIGEWVKIHQWNENKKLDESIIKQLSEIDSLCII